MPLLDFRCEHCNEEVEVIRSLETMSDDQKCSTCGESMKKIISTTSFKLKGAGWAKDGYNGKE